jgi:hypothetical protein
MAACDGLVVLETIFISSDMEYNLVYCLYSVRMRDCSNRSWVGESISQGVLEAKPQTYEVFLPF